MIQMLRAHDQVLMHGEPFHEFDVRGSKKDGFDGGIKIEDSVYEQRHSDPQKLLEAITATATKELVGFKLFRKHVPSHKLGDVLQWATHVIWLTREDRLAQYVSICLALKSGSWVQFADEKDTKSELRVRGAALRHARKIGSVVLSDEYFRLWQGAQAEFAAYADGITTLLGVENKAPQILRLSYEADLCHASLRNDTAQRIQAFLGLAPPSKQVRLPLRQGRDDLAMRVSNWDEEFVVEARRQFDEKRCRIEGRRKRKSYAANAPVTKIDGVLGAANALLRGGATESFVARLERREKEMAARKELEEKERARAREVWERDRQRLARRQREQEEREAKAAKRNAHLGRDGAARLERMMAFRRAKGLGRRLQERDLDEEKNVCIEGREVLAGMTRGVG